MSWDALWFAVFAFALASFTLISLAIAVRGLAEVRELFQSLEEHDRGGTPRQASGDAAGPPKGGAP